MRQMKQFNEIAPNHRMSFEMLYYHVGLSVGSFGKTTGV